MIIQQLHHALAAMSILHRQIITYPQPPPTYNALTSGQRQKLLQTTTKLGKILGTTPQLMDSNYTVFLDFPMTLNRVNKHLTTPSRPLSPISIKSTGSNQSTLSQYAASINESLVNHAVSSINVQRSTKRKCPPLLRLVAHSSAPQYNDIPASIHPSEKMPGSPGSYLSSKSFSPPCSPTSSEDHSIKPETLSLSRSYTIFVPRKPNPCTQNDGDSEFRLASEASSRRRKVERVRKRLGECVPIEAIFSLEEKSQADSRMGNGTTLEVVYECVDERDEDSLLVCQPLPETSKYSHLRKWFRKKIIL